MARSPVLSLARLLLSATGALAALQVDVNDVDSIKKAAAIVAEDLMSYYTGEIPGILPGPPPNGDYYFWTGGALWATMLDYRSRTGDKRYDEKISEGLMWQRGDNNDFLPANWTVSAGNDDQSIWAMAAVLAAETDLPGTKANGLDWADLAQNVYDEQSKRRITNGTCEDGLRWQIFRFNNGYDYVSTLANVAYANLGAQLSVLKPDNKDLIKGVEDTFEFLQNAKLIDAGFNVNDGVHVPQCTNVNKFQYSAAAALALESAARMLNATDGDKKWAQLVEGLAKRTVDVFFPDGVATEVGCEPDKCNTDMTFYKALLHRSLATTAQLAPQTAELILPVLKTSAAAAVKSCTLGTEKRACGLVWSGDAKTAITGAGVQMDVLSALLALLPVDGSPASGSNNNNNNNNNNTSTGSPTGDDSSKQTGTPDHSGARAVGVSSAALLAGVMLVNLLVN